MAAVRRYLNIFLHLPLTSMALSTMPKEFILYCDESSSRERHFSDFYGGVLVDSDNVDRIRLLLSAKKASLNLFGEIKWTKITENYESKYIDMTDLFFDFVADGYLKVRIMFTQNQFQLARPTSHDWVDKKYFMLYYQFIKHAFGLTYASNVRNPVNLRIYLDKMPDKNEKIDEFRNYLNIMTRSADYRASGIIVQADNVTEVKSHEHDILQCLDVVLGSINFRLNHKHKDKLAGSRLRGKRTRAKERIYKHILSRIQGIYPGFNIGITTGTQGNIANRWHHPYRHWNFLSRGLSPVEDDVEGPIAPT